MSELLPREEVLAILVRYYQALEDGSVAYILPDPHYVWRWYKGEITLERLRKGLEGLDEYLNQQSQHNWAESTYKEKFDTGPDLSRIPDPAVIALFQELDQLFAQHASSADG